VDVVIEVPKVYNSSIFRVITACYFGDVSDIHLTRNLLEHPNVSVTLYPFNVKFNVQELPEIPQFLNNISKK
jgi:hypothetical protein